MPKCKDTICLYRDKQIKNYKVFSLNWEHIINLKCNKDGIYLEYKDEKKK